MKVSGGKQTLAGGSLWAVAGRSAGAVTALAANALLARLLSPAELGAWLLLLSMVSVAALVAQAGLPQTVVRLVSESLAAGRPGRARGVVTAGFALTTVAGLLVAVAIVLGGELLWPRFFRLPGGGSLLPLAGCWVLLQAWQGIHSSVLRGFRDIRASVLFGGGISSLLFLLLLLLALCVARRAPLQEILLLANGAAACGVIAGWRAVRVRTAPLKSGGDGECTGGELLRASLPVLVAVSVATASSQADLWVMGLLKGPGEVAGYGAAARVAATIPFLLTAANVAVGPLIAEMDAQGRRCELESVLRKTALLAFLPSLLQLAFLLALGPQIMGVLFGEYYRGTAGILAILSCGKAFSVWAGACGAALLMTGHQTTLMVVTIGCALPTIAASLWLGTAYGAPGVAAASSGGLILQNVLMLLLARRKTGIWTHVPLALPQLRTLWSGGRP